MCFFFFSMRPTDYQYEQELVTAHPPSPTTQWAGLDHVPASARVKQYSPPFQQVHEEAELGAGHSTGMLEAEQAALGQSDPAWPWPRLLALACSHTTGRTERQQEGKESIWKSSWLLHLHLKLSRMGLDGENDCVYSACLHRDSLFPGNIQSVMPPKSTWHLEKRWAGLKLGCSCTGCVCGGGAGQLQRGFISPQT